MADQLAFQWPARVALGREDFFVSAANAQAHALVTNPDLWPEGKLALVGPAGSGKTHLARLLAQDTGAALMQAARLDPDAPLPSDRIVVIEDLEDLPEPSEEWLFHTHNDLRARGGRLLVTSRLAPSRWAIALPDLASRLQAATVITIDDPDDQLLGAVLMKLFMDRQLAPSPRTLDYVLRRMDRSFAAANALVDTLDRMALQDRRPITQALAREALDRLDADAG